MRHTKLRTTGTTRMGIEPSGPDLVARDQPTRAQNLECEVLMRP